MTSQPYKQVAIAKIQIIFRVYNGLPQIYTLFNRKNDFWRYDFEEEELMPFAGEKCIPPTEEEWNELIDALNLLNEKTAKDKNSYLSRFKDKYLPIKIKIEDLEHQPSRKEEHHLFLLMLWDYVDKQEHDQLMNGD